jgi:hypothetical protein
MLLELREETGVKIEEYSRASHPSEMQDLVKQGYGLCLVHEGTKLDAEFTSSTVTFWSRTRARHWSSVCFCGGV